MAPRFVSGGALENALKVSHFRELQNRCRAKGRDLGGKADGGSRSRAIRGDYPAHLGRLRRKVMATDPPLCKEALPS
ncbi:Hypothetical protein NTJ_13998 [Nesidiocoris tenuis]|uniref:Uncharacterized protein n=1 Tax=Nesidiocoris tenuis TaxID=355587 RepID=A0ABN7B9Y1_9HEMI|nr:Hypothetical protein NTJ_13998 [Nesidiocoris tenuis]